MKGKTGPLKYERYNGTTSVYNAVIPWLTVTKKNDKKNDTNVCMHITSKQIELESPGWSGLVRF